jgi:hypothetical protein
MHCSTWTCGSAPTKMMVLRASELQRVGVAQRHLLASTRAPGRYLALNQAKIPLSRASELLEPVSFNGTSWHQLLNQAKEPITRAPEVQQCRCPALALPGTLLHRLPPLLPQEFRLTRGGDIQNTFWVRVTMRIASWRRGICLPERPIAAIISPCHELREALSAAIATMPSIAATVGRGCSTMMRTTTASSRSFVKLAPVCRCGWSVIV